MRKKNEFAIYTSMWIAAVVILLMVLMQNLGEARIVNYSGIVRGATQKLVKEEMNGQPDDELIARLDKIIDNLQTGEGEFHLQRNRDKQYQVQLAKLKGVWEQLKIEIQILRQGNAASSNVYEVSQEHFIEADKMVLLAEQSSDQKLLQSIGIYMVALVFSVGIFYILNEHSRKALETSIFTDSLTGILNREGFKSNATLLLRQYPENRYCMLALDIDDFNFLNNSYGYEQGDAILQAIANHLQGKYNTDQLCAHVSSDDFFILAKKEPRLAENVRDFLTVSLHNDSHIHHMDFITFTIGVYELSKDNKLIQSLMDKANMAHKSAKAMGKSMTQWYDDTLLEKMNRENYLTKRMHQALENGEFKMFLQPKYDLKSLTIEGAEALVRWIIPGEGMVYPDEFILLFEKNGNVAEVDFYILEQACIFIRNCKDQYNKEFSISVNYSRVTLLQQRCYSKTLEIADRYQIPHHCIEIEITESAFNGISGSVVDKIQGLQDAGFVLSMDDFGSGYSSLNQLVKLPIQRLKLDKEFLWEYGVTERTENIINCVTELAHAMGIDVVCEGIEKQEHVNFLQKIGCDCGQGYYFSKPMPWEEFCQKF